MKAAIFSIFIILFLTSCSDTKPTETKGGENKDIDPLTLIPAEFQFIAIVDMDKAMTIPGISKRLIYEAKRKPSLQIVPLESIKNLYLSAGSAEDTENKGGVFIAELKEKIELKKVIEEYKAKFKDDKDVIVSTKEFRKKFIYTIRDKKQELAVCQVNPTMIVSGPLDKVLTSLKAGANNISNDDTLKELMKINKDHSIKVFLLSADKIGEALQQLKFFDQLVLSANPTEKGGIMTLTSICKDEALAVKAEAALKLVQFAMQFKISKYSKPEDLKTSKEENVATGIADLSAEALQELFIKK